MQVKDFRYNLNVTYNILLVYQDDWTDQYAGAII